MKRIGLSDVLDELAAGQVPYVKLLFGGAFFFSIATVTCLAAYAVFICLRSRTRPDRPRRFSLWSCRGKGIQAADMLRILAFYLTGSALTGLVLCLVMPRCVPAEHAAQYSGLIAPCLLTAAAGAAVGAGVLLWAWKKKRQIALMLLLPAMAIAMKARLPEEVDEDCLAAILRAMPWWVMVPLFRLISDRFSPIRTSAEAGERAVHIILTALDCSDRLRDRLTEKQRAYIGRVRCAFRTAPGV